MLTVNDKKINVYELDTENSILSRIASIFKTIPRYLYFEGKLEGNIKIRDNLKIIKENAENADSNYTDFENFLEKNTIFFKNLDIKLDVLYIWLVYNNNISEFIKQGGSIAIEYIGESFIQSKYFENIEEFKSFWNEIQPYIKKKLEMEIQNNYNQDKNFMEFYDLFEKTEEVISTEFIPEKISLELLLNIQDISILELFNYIILNKNIPFASCQTYYKILKDFIPLDSWKNKENNNTITLKINNKLNSIDYTDIKIVLNENNDFVISTKLINSKEYIDRDTLIKRIYDIFPKYKIDIKNINEKEITGMFFYPLQRMNTYIFSDLVMNDDIFSKMIDMDESIKATKRKSNNQNWLYIHFNHINTGNISASIIQKFYDKTDKEINMFKVLFENEGEPYIRIRLKGENLKSINIFKSIFSKLLTLYDEKYNDIADFYS